MPGIPFFACTVTEVHLTDEGYSMPVADAVSLNRLCLGFFFCTRELQQEKKPMETPKEKSIQPAWYPKQPFLNRCLVKQPFFM